MQTLVRVFVLGAATLASATWSAALADDEVAAVATPPPLAAAAPAAEATPPQPVVAVRANPLGLKPLSTQAMARRRGGTETLNDMRLRGVVTGNTATDVVTGGNVISEGALAGAAGLPTVIQNSGNNVLIQNATIVNVQMK